MISNTIPSFIIHLPENKEREVIIRETFKHIPNWYFYEASNQKNQPQKSEYTIEGEKFKYFGRSAIVSNRRNIDLSPTKIGCALSHLGVYTKIVKEHIPFACLFEDDIKMVGNEQVFLDILEGRSKYNDYDILVLAKKAWNDQDYRVDENNVIVDDGISGADAFVITYEGAKKLCDFSKGRILTNADDLLSWLYRFDNIIKFKAVVPAIFKQDRTIARDIVY